jgi:ferric-dicitrate binding protein FerR (iron transport regulator)
MNLTEAKQFVAQFIKGDYTPGEYEAFLRWLKGATMDDLNAIADEHESMDDQWAALAEEPSADWASKLEQKIDALEDRGLIRRLNPERFIRRNTWVAAASVIVILSAGVYLFVKEEHKKTPAPEVPATVEVAMNTYTNPRGGDQKELILEDGTKVWLNAASTLKFPSAFKGPERVVELSGEGFFEVTTDVAKPFRVKIKDAAVEVLGTHFNVMAYEDERVSRTTLIDGSVRVESGSERVVLKPGEQAEMPYPSPGVASSIKVVSVGSADAALAWKNGYFQFQDEDLRSVMRAISRAYNVDVKVDADVPEDKRITGIFSREESLDANLKLLERIKSLGIHFHNDGKLVRVTL